ncbi:hypothetical protein E2C01_030346 [Portunus trituberculatus]|uniref:Uncharacterized protein n=1 Tax=Portunus trituberculatus TaxID=210409 RepID=A0A5B7EUL7_PORTR|nr:hypothetical protein [Portunus trituberculatus]
MDGRTDKVEEEEEEEEEVARETGGMVVLLVCWIAAAAVRQARRSDQGGAAGVRSAAMVPGVPQDRGNGSLYGWENSPLLRLGSLRG